MQVDPDHPIQSIQSVPMQSEPVDGEPMRDDSATDSKEGRKGNEKRALVAKLQAHCLFPALCALLQNLEPSVTTPFGSSVSGNERKSPDESDAPERKCPSGSSESADADESEHSGSDERKQSDDSGLQQEDKAASCVSAFETRTVGRTTFRLQFEKPTPDDKDEKRPDRYNEYLQLHKQLHDQENVFIERLRKTFTVVPKKRKSHARQARFELDNEPIAKQYLQERITGLFAALHSEINAGYNRSGQALAPRPRRKPRRHSSPDASSEDDDESSKKGPRPPKKSAQKKRGALPAAAVKALKEFLFQHLDHPYPEPEDVQNFSRRFKIRVKQIAYWFINARVRIWRPLIKNIAQAAQAKTATQSKPD